MLKSNRVLMVTSFAMIIIGIFSMVTGFMSVIGYSEMINDYVGDKELFNFINGGAYFMLCGAIHIFVSLLALSRIKNARSKLICVAVGLFTLAWQLAAFIYLLTLSFLSLRAGLMVIFPIVYLTASIISSVKERTSLVNEKGESDQPHKKIATPKDFLNFQFSFKRKNIDGLFSFRGKRQSKKIGSVNFSGKRRSARFNLKPTRKFKARRR